MHEPEIVSTVTAEHLVPAADLLAGTGMELRALAECVDAMEGLVGNLVVAGAFAGSQSVYQLQDLDRLRQSLEAIADFLDALARTMPAHLVDARAAAASLKLSDLTRRLAQLPTTQARAEARDPGELVLFDQSA